MQDDIAHAIILNLAGWPVLAHTLHACDWSCACPNFCGCAALHKCVTFSRHMYNHSQHKYIHVCARIISIIVINNARLVYMYIVTQTSSQLSCIANV